MSAPVRSPLPVQPLLPVVAPPASLWQRVPLHRRVRRLLLLGLAAFLVFNSFLASRAIYRAWQGRGSERQQMEGATAKEFGNQIVTRGGVAADNAVEAATASALSSAVGAVKHTAKAAGQAVGVVKHTAKAAGQAVGVVKHTAKAAGQAVGAAGPAAAKAAATVGAAAKGAASLAVGTVKGSPATGNDMGAQLKAASVTAAKGVPAEPEPQDKKKARELPPPPHVSEASNDTCAQALGLSKVALLFLTYGGLPDHEAAWRLWFASAAGLLPAQATEATVCKVGGADYDALRQACTHDQETAGRAQPTEQQHLFSVYVHAPPSFEGYPPGSLWGGHLIKRRVPTSWGDISLVEATRSLLWESFKDPLNQRFVLLSESDIPLYDPLTLHQQLLAEAKSRVNACSHTNRHEWRWSRDMETEHMNASHWRKSGQFLGLTRVHVEAVLQDTEVFRSFEQHCVYEWDAARNAFRDCFPDEHYFATLLAVLGREGETECGGWGVATQDWSKGGAHPREYRAAEVTQALVHRMRDFANCNSSAAYADAQRAYVDATEELGAGHEGACQQLRATATEASYAHAMPGSCPLTARKFLGAKTAAVVVKLFNSSCFGGEGSTDKGQQAGGADVPTHLLSARYCQRVAATAAASRQ